MISYRFQVAFQQDPSIRRLHEEAALAQSELALATDRAYRALEDGDVEQALEFLAAEQLAWRRYFDCGAKFQELVIGALTRLRADD